MLRDDGIVMDDGTSWRLSEDEYFMTTSTAQAARVMAWLEELLQTRWTDMKVHITTVSEQWAAAAVSGPKSRDTLRQCVEDQSVCVKRQSAFHGVDRNKVKRWYTLQNCKNQLLGRIGL